MLTQNTNETGCTCFEPGTYRCSECTMVERQIADFGTFPVCGFCHTGVRWIMVEPAQMAELVPVN